MNLREVFRMRWIVIFLAAIAISTAASSQSINGVYDISPEACTREMSDGRVNVQWNNLGFWESACQLTNPTTVRGMQAGALFDLKCSGEGEEWASRALVGLDYDGGLIIYNDGGMSKYFRC